MRDCHCASHEKNIQDIAKAQQKLEDHGCLFESVGERMKEDREEAQRRHEELIESLSTLEGSLHDKIDSINDRLEVVEKGITDRDAVYSFIKGIIKWMAIITGIGATLWKFVKLN